jgi:hypothetical protein
MAAEPEDDHRASDTGSNASGDDVETRAGETEDYVGVPISDDELGRAWEATSDDPGQPDQSDQD